MRPTGGRSVKTEGLRIYSILLCVLLLICAARPGIGQVDQGTITGVVTDSTGAVVPNAQVTVTNVDTSLTLQGTTDGAGVYVFTPLKVGHYNVSATAPGFSTTSQENLQLDVQARLNVPLSLKLGGTTERIVVSTAPPLLQTEQASVGQVISTEQINNTPLNGRNWVYISHLTAGVAPSVGQSRGASTGDFFANGQRATQNNFILDGVDNNVNDIDFMNGSSYVIRPPPDALAEFKIETSNFSAEFGHSAGAVLNASIKSGTNSIHGSLWEYLRNTKLDAKDWTATSVPAYHENQFGGTLGFPILKNKLFYFGDIEANRITVGSTSTSSVPTPLMRTGNFTELLNTALSGQSKPIQLYQPNSGAAASSTAQYLQCNGQNNVFCPSQMSALALQILNEYPAPNTNGGKLANNFVITVNNSSNTIQWDQRIDWNVTAKDQAFVRFSYDHVQGNNPQALGNVLGANTATTSVLSEGATGSETHIFNPRLINEARFGYTYGVFLNVQLGYLDPSFAVNNGFGGVPSGTLFPLNGGIPVGVVSGISTFGNNASFPSVEHQNVYQILDNLTKIAGSHSLKFGVTLQSIRMAFLQPSHSRGQYNYTGLYTSSPGTSFTGYGVADFLANQMNSGLVSNEFNTNDTRWYRAGYFEDDWKTSPKLTLNLGMRYDYYQPYKENGGNQADFIPGASGIGMGTGSYLIPTQAQHVPVSTNFLAALAKDNVALTYVNNPYLVSPQHWNFGPRIGFAYSATPTTVMRSGFGIFYGGLESFGGANLGASYPFSFSSTYNAPTCAVANCPSVGIYLETGFVNQLNAGLGNAVANPVVQTILNPLKTAYTINYNVSIERAITQNWVATLSYVGNGSRHLETAANGNGPNALVNTAVNLTTVEPYPDLGQDNLLLFAGTSSYNSLQAKLQKRLSNGFEFLSTYTWGHSFDNTSSPISTGTARVSNMIPISMEYAPSYWDLRQRFTFNGFYAIPYGKSRKYHAGNAVVNAIAGDWSTSFTFSAQSGSPFTVTPDTTTVAVGGRGTVKTIVISDPLKPGGTADPSNSGTVCATQTRTRTHWFNPCAYANPLPASLISPKPGGPSGTDPTALPVPNPNGYQYPQHVTGLANAIAFTGGLNNQTYGPGYERINMSLFKNFPTFREQRVEFRVDAFNLLNHPSWGNPSIMTDASNGGQITTSKNFQANSPDARFFQLSAKYVF
jgi:hypothetical protein